MIYHQGEYTRESWKAFGEAVCNARKMVTYSDNEYEANYEAAYAAYNAMVESYNKLEKNQGEDYIQAMINKNLVFNVPSSVKIGEKLEIKCSGAADGQAAVVKLDYASGQKFALTGFAYGCIPINALESGFYTQEEWEKWKYSDITSPLLFAEIENDRFLGCYGEAISPGTINADCYSCFDYDYIDGGDPIASITTVVEEPEITTNLKNTYYVGDLADFKTALENTALSQMNIEEFKTSGSEENGRFTYQASVEVVEGEDLISRGEIDNSVALTSNETISFTGEGTVKFRIKYNPVLNEALLKRYFPYLFDETGLIDEVGKDISAIYVPETYITVKVENAQENLSNLIDDIENENLDKNLYTEETWNTFAQALENANGVLASSDATNEAYASAYQNLLNAKNSLKTKTAEPTVTPQDENGDAAKKGNASDAVNNTLSTDNSGGTTKAEAADTSDANDAMLPFVICIIAVGATSVIIRYKKSR